MHSHCCSADDECCAHDDNENETAAVQFLCVAIGIVSGGGA